MGAFRVRVRRPSVFYRRKRQRLTHTDNSIIQHSDAATTRLHHIRVSYINQSKPVDQRAVCTSNNPHNLLFTLRRFAELLRSSTPALLLNNSRISVQNLDETGRLSTTVSTKVYSTDDFWYSGVV